MSVKTRKTLVNRVHQMLVHFGTRIRSPTRTNLFSPFPTPLKIQIPKSLKTLKMSTRSESNSKPKRPTCPSCSKPARVCICSRIRTRNLENSVSVTILQHSSETKHPLNSTRIAKLGLKNLNVIIVYEVDFEARFDIRLLEPGYESSLERLGWESSGCDQVGAKQGIHKVGFVPDGNAECPKEKSRDLLEKNGEFSVENDVRWSENAEKSFKSLKFDSGGDEVLLESSGRECVGAKDSLAMENPCEKLGEESNSNEADFDENGAVCGVREGPVIRATMIKYGFISDLSHIWKVDIHGKKLKKPKFDHILSSTLARDALAGGFVVKKFQRRKLDEKMEGEENEEFEFEVKIPSGSVLVFPSQNAVGVDDLKSMDFEVKNLIVLDGTWSKAGRIYNENPWLKLLPHLKLDLDKMSLYSEIRSQPKAGYLSTIESIVYTLKALGDNVDGLDNLLDVFESMVGDQRRLKNERLSIC